MRRLVYSARCAPSQNAKFNATKSGNTRRNQGSEQTEISSAIRWQCRKTVSQLQLRAQIIRGEMKRLDHVEASFRARAVDLPRVAKIEGLKRSLDIMDVHPPLPDDRRGTGSHTRQGRPIGIPVGSPATGRRGEVLAVSHLKDSHSTEQVRLFRGSIPPAAAGAVPGQHSCRLQRFGGK